MDSVPTFAMSNAVVATFLALLAAGLTPLCRRPALAHGLWLLVLLKLVTPPLVPVSLPRAAADAAATPYTLLAAASSPFSPQDDGFAARPGEEVPLVFAGAMPEEFVIEALEETPAQEPMLPPALVSDRGVSAEVLAWMADWWQPALLSIWLAGAAAWFGLALVRIGRFHALLRYATPAPEEIQEQARELAYRLGLESCPAVELLPGAVSPMLWTLCGRARLLLPAALVERLNAEQRATLVAHELAHLRRRDPWVRVLELVATGLYWWHPVVWWARRELREAEEQCCDAWVVWALPRAARSYAAALLETIDFLSEVRVALPPAASGIGHVTLLKRRLTMIMQANTPRAASWLGFVALLGLAAVCLPTWLYAEPPSEQNERVIKELRAVRKQVEDKQVQKELDRLIEQLQEGKKVEKRVITINVDGDVKTHVEDLKGHAKEIAEKAKAEAKDHAEHAKKLKEEIHKKMEVLKDEQVQKALRGVRVYTSRDEDDQDEKKIKRKSAESSEDADKAKEAVKKAEAEMKAAQKQFQDAIRRLVEAQLALGKAGGKPGVFTFGEGKGNFQIQTMPGGGGYRFELKPGTVVTPRARAGQGKDGDSDKRLSELEEKLSDLLKEVKSLKKEMQQTPRPRGRQSPTSSAAPETAPVPPLPPATPAPAVPAVRATEVTSTVPPLPPVPPPPPVGRED